MTKIFVAEDETRILNTICNIVETYCSGTDIIGTGHDVKSSTAFLKKNEADLVLLDINYPDGTGFDILKQISNYNFKIIFITAYEQYALQAIKFSALDFILKPIDPKELIDSIKNAQKEIGRDQISTVKIETLLSNIKTDVKKRKKLVLRTQEKIIVVDINDIIRCESDSSYTTFYMADHKKIVISKGLSEYDDLLKDYNFIRTHKSHLVNVNYIDSYIKQGGGYLCLKDKSNVPVSVRKKDSVIKAIENI